MNNIDFQTHPDICDYMVSMIPSGCEYQIIMEPTPGKGNIVASLKNRKFTDWTILTPDNFWDAIDCRPDVISMNPPFTPMSEGYKILFQAMKMTDYIIALMPWLTIINSQERSSLIRDFGLESVTHLPRNAFPGSRVQTCILQMNYGFSNKTEFKFYA